MKITLMGSVLIACEESQVVTIEFRKIGTEAYSCDTLPCSGEHPEYHLQQDVTSLLKQQWDMIIAFPPCTHLCSSGARWFAEKRKDGRQKQGIDFFMKFANVDCHRVAIENPIGIMSTLYRKPDQIIQPWQFGEFERKSTCLWLKNLPLLKPTKIIHQTVDYVHTMGPSKERSRMRSKTYKGIAQAMASQWGAFLYEI